MLHWLPVPRSVVQSLVRFSTRPIPLRMFLRMMREIGEKVLCGKHWHSVSQCCKQSESSNAVANAITREMHDKGMTLEEAMNKWQTMDQLPAEYRS